MRFFSFLCQFVVIILFFKTTYATLCVLYDVPCHAILEKKFVFVTDRGQGVFFGEGDSYIPFNSALKSVIVLTRVSR